MSITIILQAFEKTPLKSKQCVSCGNGIDNAGRRDTGPKDKNTCGYSCYRIFWLFKQNLRTLENQPYFLADLITLINNGTNIIEVKKIYKFKKILGTLETHPKLREHLITLIHNGTNLDEVKKIYKSEQNNRFKRPYKYEVEN